MIPYSNATLTAITPPGAGDAYDADPAAPSARWTGEVAVYVAEQLVQVELQDRVDELVRTRIEIPYAVGRLVQRGDTLTYSLDAAAQKPRTVENIVSVRLLGRVRVTLTTG